MKKHTLLTLGLLFLSQWVHAQEVDSIMRHHATEKMKIFSGLLQNIAMPGLNLATKSQIQRTIEGDFLDQGEVFLYNDLNNPFGINHSIEATSYFAQLKALYPNGAKLNSSSFEVSDIFYNQARDMFYIIFRCQRTFSGLNALAKKEVVVNKVIDYQVKISEAGQISLNIVSGWESEGPLNTPLGLDKPLSELPAKKLVVYGSIVPEEFKIEEAKKLLKTSTEMSNRYEELQEVKENRNESPAERKQRKILARAEKARLERETKKAKLERNSLTTKRINIRLGFGFFASDSMVNNMPSRIANQRFTSWLAKADVQYKFTGISRLPNGQWQKAHTMGLFMNYGKQSVSNINHMTRTGSLGAGLDTTSSGRGFFEAELGVMLREEFRISGGMGNMNFPLVVDGVRSNGSKSYYSFTAGLAPRLCSFLEMDFNVTGMLIDGVLKPRANMNLVLLLKAKRK